MLQNTLWIALHVISAALWLSVIPAAMILNKEIKASAKTPAGPGLIRSLVKFIGFAGNVGGNGVLITGIIMVLTFGYYSFFQFDGNHWLTSKQFLMVFLLVIVFAVVIPASKKIKAGLESNTSSVSDEVMKQVGKLVTWSYISGVMIVLNFLFAYSRRLMGQ